MMNVLEKILEEIDNHAIEFESFGMCDDYVSVGWVKEIIRSHMNDLPDDGWIPVEERLPNEGEEVEVTIEEMADSAGGMIYYTKTAWVQDGRWVIKRNPYNPRVIAWRELPEPHKPKKL